MLLIVFVYWDQLMCKRLSREVLDVGAVDDTCWGWWRCMLVSTNADKQAEERERYWWVERPICAAPPLGEYGLIEILCEDRWGVFCAHGWQVLVFQVPLISQQLYYWHASLVNTRPSWSKFQGHAPALACSSLSSILHRTPRTPALLNEIARNPSHTYQTRDFLSSA